MGGKKLTSPEMLSSSRTSVGLTVDAQMMCAKETVLLTCVRGKAGHGAIIEAIEIPMCHIQPITLVGEDVRMVMEKISWNPHR